MPLNRADVHRSSGGRFRCRAQRQGSREGTFRDGQRLHVFGELAAEGIEERESDRGSLVVEARRLTGDHHLGRVRVNVPQSAGRESHTRRPDEPQVIEPGLSPVVKQAVNIAAEKIATQFSIEPL